MAMSLPAETIDLLDLGCGTGLELDFIFTTHPNVRVTGIDLTSAMLDSLGQKHPDRDMTLICGDYRITKLGSNTFDAAISFESLHHLKENEKAELYTRIYQALRPGGTYIECDYMAADCDEEARLLAEYARVVPQRDSGPRDIYHIDIPLCVEHQQDLLRKSGFTGVELLFRHQGTAMILASKC
jgi:cyclopropane fatty-acyl-phospholipid synthase-like methyltransferase